VARHEDNISIGGVAYQFLPSGINFTVPVNVTLKHEGALFAEGDGILALRYEDSYIEDACTYGVSGEASKVMDPPGGALELGDAKLVFPASAVSAPTNITIRELDLQCSGISGSPSDIASPNAITVTVGGVPITNSTRLTGEHLVELEDSVTGAKVTFNFDFTTSTLDLSEITLYSTDTYIIVSLGGQLQGGQTKSITMADNGFTSLCVKDAEITLIGEMSDACDGANETSFTSCLGNSAGITLGGITCTDLGGTIRFEGLSYSGVRGGIPSGGGGEGERGGGNKGGGGVIVSGIPSEIELPPPEEKPPEQPPAEQPPEQPGEEPQEQPEATPEVPEPSVTLEPTPTLVQGKEFPWVFITILALAITGIIGFVLMGRRR
jgi:hypothetical protein